MVAKTGSGELFGHVRFDLPATHALYTILTRHKAVDGQSSEALKTC